MTEKNEKPLTGIIKPGRQPVSIEEYEKAGGYQGLRKALKMPPKQIQQMVSDSNLLIFSREVLRV